MIRKMFVSVFVITFLTLACTSLSYAYQVTLFSDDFNDNSIDSAKWTVDVSAGGSYITEAGKRLQCNVVGASGGRHANLISSTFDASGWSDISFSGQWAASASSPHTAAMYVTIYNADNPLQYLQAQYDRYYTRLYLHDSGSQLANLGRSYSTSLTSFALNLTKAGWAFYENGFLVQNFVSTSLAGANNFYIRIGGWDVSHYTNQDIYFDNISVGAEINEIPEPMTMILLGSLATGLFSVAGIRRK